MSPSTWSARWGSALSSYVWQPYESKETGVFSYYEILRIQAVNELRLTWLPRDARIPHLPKYKKQYQRTFKGRLFPPGGPKK